MPEICLNALSCHRISKSFELETATAAEELLARRQADAIIQLQIDFSDRLKSGHQAPVQLIINGIDANRARLIQGYVRTVVGQWSTIRRERGEEAGRPPVLLAQRIWFNEDAESRNFMVPGLITLIMTLTGILLTALVVAREWERGTMEAMLVTPLRRVDILLGKILPYYLLGMLGMGLSVGVAIIIFQVPFRGSLAALVLLSSLFMLASLGLGLLLSAAIRIQFVAAQASIVVGFLPAFFLSGLIFDLESTPRFIQLISHIVPARYFVTISHTLFMAGDVWPVLLPNGLVLGGMAVLFVGLAYQKYNEAAGEIMQSLRRILALVIKEFVIILKDPKSRVVIIGPPLLQFFVFGYAATYDLENVRYAVFDESRSVLSRQLLARVEGSGIFRLTGSLTEAGQITEYIDNEEARLVIHIGPQFHRDLHELGTRHRAGHRRRAQSERGAGRPRLFRLYRRAVQPGSCAAGNRGRSGSRPSPGRARLV